MDVSSEETATACAERRESADTVSVPPALWRSVVHAFRQAQLQRWEARVNRMRRRLHVVPTVDEQTVMLVAVEPHSHADREWSSGAMPARRAWSLTGVVCVLMLIGVTLSVPVVWSRAGSAVALVPSAAESHVMPAAQEVRELRTLLTSLDERVTMLHRQVLQQGDQLTNHAATALSVTQHAETQQTHMAALADALGVLTSQVTQIEQQVTTQAARLAAHEQQVMHTTQREPVPPPPQHVSRVAAKTVGRSSRPRPPTLELFAPPSAQTPTPAPSLSASLPAAGALSQRRSITLPAALGAEGYRAATGRTGGTPP